MRELIDSHQRKFVYLRLSITDRCNFRCVYCLPQGYQAKPGQESELTLDEIERLVRGFSRLGVSKIRLTGGEPTVRRDITEVIRRVKSVRGIEKVALTTNGYRLYESIEEFKNAGLDAVNVSVDSLDRERFHKLTGTDRLEHVLKGIDRAIGLGFREIKVNSVLFKDSTESDFARFTDWVRDMPVSVRFIELMRTGKNLEFFSKNHVSSGEIQFRLQREGWRQKPRMHDDGPAVTYEHAQYRGRIGIIAPYSKDFCKTCNRLRVSSRGDLRLCLFGEKDETLRPYLQSDSDPAELIARIQTLLKEKPVSHRLHEGIYGNTWNLAGIGG